MKIFVSWSGTRSHHIASTLRDWLPNVLQPARPFISSRDIRKGTRGNVRIAKELETANVGIICLTPENIDKAWILFEAGALSKLASAYVCTYLYDIEPADVPPPLGQFQHTRATKEETCELLSALNDALPDGQGLDAARFDRAFSKWWPDLKSALKDTPGKPDDEVGPPERTNDDKLDEVLKLMRSMNANRGPVTLSGDAVEIYIDFPEPETEKQMEIVNSLSKIPDPVHANCAKRVSVGVGGGMIHYDVSSMSKNEQLELVAKLRAIASEINGRVRVID